MLRNIQQKNLISVAKLFMLAQLVTVSDLAGPLHALVFRLGQLGSFVSGDGCLLVEES